MYYERNRTDNINEFSKRNLIYYDDNRTYHVTVNSGTNSYEYILTLEDESTLRWTVYTKKNESVGLNLGEKWYEIVLKRSGSSYDPNDYNGDNTNTNNNSNGNNNTSPTPSPDTPPQINDRWEITSGSGLISRTISGKVYVSHPTYSPQRGDSGLEIDIAQNDISTYYS